MYYSHVWFVVYIIHTRSLRILISQTILCDFIVAMVYEQQYVQWHTILHRSTMPNAHPCWLWTSSLLTANILLQFFSIVYTQKLVPETQWPQHVTHAPIPWINSTKLQAQFLLYTQIAVLKHTFFKKTLHTILHLAHFLWRNTLSFKILKLTALLFTLTHHMDKHLSHSFTISHESLQFCRILTHTLQTLAHCVIT